MRKIIHKLRRQPEEVRRYILHILIFAVAIIMIILWVFSLSKNISSPSTQIKIKQDLQPFSVLKDNIVDGYNNTKDINTPTE